jgi:hypothetical protein
MIERVRGYWTLLRVGLVVLWVRLLLRLKSLPQVLDLLNPCVRTGEQDDAAMKKLISCVDCWLRLFPYNTKGNCFPRSLVLYRFARQLGYPVVFHCGVRKEASSLDGHAWLTLESRAFHEPTKHWQYYIVTFSYPPDPATTVSRGSATGHPSLQTMES